MEPFEIKNILIPVDFSDSSIKAVDEAVEMAQRTKASITLIHVIDNMLSVAPAFYASDRFINFYENDLTELTNIELNKIAESIKAKGINLVNVESVNGQIKNEIIKYSEINDMDIIIMGSHGTSGFANYFIGSNTSRVVSHSKCPVLSVQNHVNQHTHKNIIVPFRDKPHAREKINYAISIAQIYGATLHVLGVDTENTKEHFNKMMLEGEQVKRIIEEFGVDCKLQVISESYVADTVLKYSKEKNADMIIVTADMDKVSISEYFMGPFAQQILNHSPIPVLSILPTFNTDTVDLRFY